MENVNKQLLDALRIARKKLDDEGYFPTTEIDLAIAAAEQAQQAEPVAWKLFKQALFVGMERACVHYLMANAHGRRDGALKAHNHEQLCRHVIAAVRGCDPDWVRREYEDDYNAVHDGTQALTSYLDEVIGFPLDSRPDYDDLTPKFFDKFFELAMDALSVGVPDVADDELEEMAKRHGVRWDGDFWAIEDADFHPFMRAMLAAAQKGGAA